MQARDFAPSVQNITKALSPSGTSTLNEFLAFNLGREEYAINILKVQEIRSHENVTHIANAPDFIKGVMNLRGTIVPIIDMRIKFQLDDVNDDQFTALIILNLEARIVGMVVDRVSDVVSISHEQIRPAPEFSSTFDSHYLTGLGSLNERMLILVDIDKLMSSSEMGLTDALAT